MKKFREYLNEETMPYAQTEKGFVGVDNGPVRDNINIHLASVTAKPYASPYHAMEIVRKALAAFSIFPPSTNFLDGDSGHEIFAINQFGDKMGMTNDGQVVVKSADPYFLYFEYAMNDKGSFDVFCEIVTEDELDEILSDLESEMEENPTTSGNGDDAEDSFDEYKSENQIKEEVESIVEQVLSENSLKDFQPPFKAEGLYVSDKRGNSVLEVTRHGKVAQEVAKALNMHVSHIKEDKDPCWDNPPHKMVGMKMKNGRKVPKCVPVEEEQLHEGPFSKIGKLVMKRKLKDEIKKHGDKADDALNKNAVPGASMNSNWDEKTWSKESKQENRKKKVLKRLEKK